jgi:hypothetical protein
VSAASLRAARARKAEFRAAWILLAIYVVGGYCIPSVLLMGVFFKFGWLGLAQSVVALPVDPEPARRG